MRGGCQHSHSNSSSSVSPSALLLLLLPLLRAASHGIQGISTCQPAA
jgi:hypothetical protein